MSFDLTSHYLGLKLQSPLVVSACQPLSGTIDNIRQIEDAKAGAVVLYSLFEEQIRRDTVELHRHTTQHTDSFSEAASFFPEPETFLTGPEEYLEHIAKAKKAVEIPIIASLNGSTSGGWTSFARGMEQAGADAIELNLYQVQTDLNRDALSVEREYLDIVRAVRASVKLPVAVKLSPYFTNLSNMAKQLDDIGVNGLVLFNRFYQPDIDLENLRVHPNVLLSSPLSMRLPMRWIAILYGKISADLAATSGVQRTEDVIKLLMAGASVTMFCSALIRYGFKHLRKVRKELEAWMADKGYASTRMMKGSMSQINCEHPPEFERAQYIRGLHDFRPEHWRV